ncbi:universal stress protein [Chloroflexota bacterium]
MDEKIVVPLDGSKVGEAALPYVEDLVSKMSPDVKVEVILLQVLQVAPIPVVGGEAYTTKTIDFATVEKTKEENKKKASDYLDAMGEALKSKGATVTTRVAIGNASEEIVNIAEEIDANLIAMSTHGRAGLSRWAFGSVTDKVLRLEGRIPIAMVRAPKATKGK